MKFSIITVSYNHAEFIRDTIESVLAQNYPDFEHFVIDGGSSDGTLDILKDYPHLRWISEPDRGQSHALNKGFRMATGDVICWLNSDDCYAPETFHEVAKHIYTSSVIIGASELMHRDGTRFETRANVARGWYDTLKNWVYFSSPDQPSVFFRREVLEEFPLPNGDFIDEDLYFGMDYDFWLRIGKKYPLSHYIPKTLSYIRVYDAAKTGAHMASVYREMSRVFRRHEAQRVGIEQEISIVIPLNGTIGEIEPLLAVLQTSTVPKLEVIIADRSPAGKNQRENRKELFALEATYSRLNLRYTFSESPVPTTWSVIDNAIRRVRSPVVVVLDKDSVITSNFCLDVLKEFERDNLGILLPRELVSQSNQSALVTAPEALKIGSVTSGFALRTITYLEMIDCNLKQSNVLHLRMFTTRAIHRAWIALSSHLLSVGYADFGTREHEKSLSLYTNAQLIDEFYREITNEPFAALRASNGFALQVPENLWQIAKYHLEQAPQNWTVVHEVSTEHELRNLIAQCPQFSPSRLLLAELLEKRGATTEAQAERATYQELSSVEMQSPLYS